jgi:VanZ family protein
MKLLQNPWFRLSLLILWLGIVLILTTQANYIPPLQRFLDRIVDTELGEKGGHAALFAGLTLAFYLVGSALVRRHWALWASVLISLVLSVFTELAQNPLPGRNASISDLLANLAGVFAVGYAIASVQIWRTERILKRRVTAQVPQI